MKKKLSLSQQAAAAEATAHDQCRRERDALVEAVNSMFSEDHPILWPCPWCGHHIDESGRPKQETGGGPHASACPLLIVRILASRFRPRDPLMARIDAIDWSRAVPHYDPSK